MKRTKLLVLIVAAICLSKISLAQNFENQNPYAIFGKTFVLGEEAKNDKPGVREVPDAVFVIENPSAGSLIARLEHNTRTGIVLIFDRAGKIIGEKLLTDAERAWLTQDPKAEKYYPVSPYAYANNNPVRYVDPSGMDVYRYDDKTGAMILAKQTNDSFDQIGKFQYDKKRDIYTLKTNSKGEARTRMDNIEKGILRDGMNFMTNDNMWAIGDEGQLTVDGFQNFVVGFADMIGKEVAGFYFSRQGKNDVNYIYMGRHINNTQTESKTGLGPYNLQPSLMGVIQPHTAWHTHPSNFPDALRLVPSGLLDGRGDVGFKRNQSIHGFKNFIILTGGHPPINY